MPGNDLALLWRSPAGNGRRFRRSDGGNKRNALNRQVVDNLPHAIDLYRVLRGNHARRIIADISVERHNPGDHGGLDGFRSDGGISSKRGVDVGRERRVVDGRLFATSDRQSKHGSEGRSSKCLFKHAAWRHNHLLEFCVLYFPHSCSNRCHRSSNCLAAPDPFLKSTSMCGRGHHLRDRMYEEAEVSRNLGRAESIHNLRQYSGKGAMIRSIPGLEF